MSLLILIYKFSIAPIVIIYYHNSMSVTLKLMYLLFKKVFLALSYFSKEIILTTGSSLDTDFSI